MDTISSTSALIPAFDATLLQHQQDMSRLPLKTLQINLGKLCNLACHHCHVDAGPKRTEIMQRKTIEQVLQILDNSVGITTVDLTGGAPEMNPHFRQLIKELAKRQLHIIDRCNLAVLLETGQEDTAAFLAQHNVEIVASLPCYSRDNVDKQRGNGSFDKSITALKQLNQLGYGTTKPLNLVYNPTGASLPPDQQELEQDYKQRLYADFGIVFNQLLTITNMPIHRFAHQLQLEQHYDNYMDLLYENFNPDAAKTIMCRNLISISWDGKLYDCDFNQMLELPLGNRTQTVFNISSFNDLEKYAIHSDSHCYGCTAGHGSSCSGSLT